MDLLEKLLDENYDWGDERLDEEMYDELSAALVIDYLKKHDAATRQKLALCWNFDNAKEVIQWIVDQPDTDKGTCLLLYWLMAPAFSKQFADRSECEATHKWYLEDYDIIQTIEQNYLSGFYQNQLYAFNPCNDTYHEGYDWTKELHTEDFKVPIPQEMLTALNGIELENPYWEEGIPNDLQPAMDRLGELIEEEYDDEEEEE